jgi:hypothetical protein
MRTKKTYTCSSGIAIDCWKTVERGATGNHPAVCEACKKKKAQEYAIIWGRNKRARLKKLNKI